MNADMEARIVEHLPLVSVVVSIVLRTHRLPAVFERDELEAAARVGLVEAAQRWRADGGANFKTFAWRRIYGAVLDEIRKRGAMSRAGWRKFRDGDLSAGRSVVSLDSDPLLSASLHTYDPDVRDLFTLQRMQAALATLPPRDARVLRLYYRDELTMRAIGAAMGVSESLISQIHARAVRRLRDALGVQPCLN